ncbi:MAG TPA: hypothetical protein VFA35_03650, partial [Burkholderiaceae bacterium]|nr:hypothetical protein [Burkholderiaceae bacterium]
MTDTLSFSRPRLVHPAFAQVLAGLMLAAALAVPAHAERSDRLQKINIAADQSGQIDLQNQVVAYTGNVVISRGT